VLYLALFVSWENFLSETQGNITGMWSNYPATLCPRLRSHVSNISLLRKSTDDARKDGRVYRRERHSRSEIPGVHLADDITIHFGPPLSILLESQETKGLAIPGLPRGAVLIRPITHTLNLANSYYRFLRENALGTGCLLSQNLSFLTIKLKGRRLRTCS